MFRSDFPIFSTHPNLVFLDSASSAQKPKIVIDSLSHFFSSSYANIHRWAYDLSMESSQFYEQAKTSIAKCLNLTSYHEVVFTYNATYAFNLISRALIKTGKLKMWDTVLLSKADHHANIVPWQILAEEYGITIDWIELHSDGTLDYESLSSKITNSTVISISGASNVTGEILDLERVRIMIQSQWVPPLWILDGSQRFPHMKTDMSQYGIDIFVATGHKVMSDTGIGFFAAKKEFLQKLIPAFCGGGAINAVTIEWYEVAWLPFRHEPGTPHIAGAVSLLASLDYIESIWGFEVIEKYEQELVAYTLEKIKNLPKWIRLIGSNKQENRLWVFSFSFDDHHPNDIAEILADLGICVRSWHHCTDPLHTSLGIRGSLRMSLYIYNNKQDIDTFFDELVKAVSL
jgi:cysteine desulfurase/selenocysteine lyase